MRAIILMVVHPIARALRGSWAMWFVQLIYFHSMRIWILSPSSNALNQKPSESWCIYIINKGFMGKVLKMVGLGKPLKSSALGGKLTEHLSRPYASTKEK